MNSHWHNVLQTQPIVTKIFLNSKANGRLLHAHLLVGEAAVMNEEIGRALATLILCSQPVDHQPCGACKNCVRITKGMHPDVIEVQQAEATIKKEQIEAFCKELSRSGVESSKKVFLIFEADKLTMAAGNRLLKSIEEPVGEFYYIFMSAYEEKVLGTIASRCQTVKLHPVQKDVMLKQILLETEDIRLATLSLALCYSIEQAITLLQTDWFAKVRTLVLKLYDVQKTGKYETWAFIRSEWMSVIKEKEQFEIALRVLSLFYRDLMTLELDNHAELIFAELSEIKEDQFQRLGQQRRIKQLLAIHEATKQLEHFVQPQTIMEQLNQKLQEV
ncbi:MAG: hypothetical protein ACRCWQ_04170 [Bacilli bacterium]